MEREKNTLPQKACHWMAAVIISLFVLPPVHAQRQTQTINDSWKFLKGECTAAADSAFDDSKWTSICPIPGIPMLIPKRITTAARAGIAGN